MDLSRIFEKRIDNQTKILRRQLVVFYGAGPTGGVLLDDIETFCKYFTFYRTC